MVIDYYGCNVAAHKARMNVRVSLGVGFWRGEFDFFFFSKLSKL